MSDILRIASKEIRSTLRDRRTLIFSVIFPIIFIPLFLTFFPLLIKTTFSNEAEKHQEIGVIGLKNAPKDLIDALTADTEKGKGLKLVIVDDPLEAVRSGKVEAAIKIPQFLEKTTLSIYAKTSSQKSQIVINKIESSVAAYREQIIEKRLKIAGLSSDILHPIDSKVIDADTKEAKDSGPLAFLIPLFLIQWILIGGQATAIDSTAGEKERGTLEALLSTPVSRFSIVIGKLLAVFSFSVASTTFSMLGLLLTGIISKTFLQDIFQTGTDIMAFSGVLNITFTGFLVLLVSGLTIALLTAAILLSICIFARSFKEAQTYIAPFAIILIIPMVGLQFADFLQRGTTIYAIPILGSAITILDIVKDQLNGSGFIISILSNLIFSGLAIYWALRNFSRESVVFRN